MSFLSCKICNWLLYDWTSKIIKYFKIAPKSTICKVNIVDNTKILKLFTISLRNIYHPNNALIIIIKSGIIPRIDAVMNNNK